VRRDARRDARGDACSKGGGETQKARNAEETRSARARGGEGARGDKEGVPAPLGLPLSAPLGAEAGIRDRPSLTRPGPLRIRVGWACIASFGLGGLVCEETTREREYPAHRVCAPSLVCVRRRGALDERVHGARVEPALSSLFPFLPSSLPLARSKAHPAARRFTTEIICVYIYIYIICIYIAGARPALLRVQALAAPPLHRVPRRLRRRPRPVPARQGGSRPAHLTDCSPSPPFPLHPAPRTRFSPCTLITLKALSCLHPNHPESA
jgi:hypothetical protein